MRLLIHLFTLTRIFSHHLCRKRSRYATGMSSESAGDISPSRSQRLGEHRFYLSPVFFYYFELNTALQIYTHIYQSISLSDANMTKMCIIISILYDIVKRNNQNIIHFRCLYVICWRLGIYTCTVNYTPLKYVSASDTPLKGDLNEIRSTAALITAQKLTGYRDYY